MASMHRLTRNNLILVATLVVCMLPILILYAWATSEQRHFNSKDGAPFTQAAAIRSALNQYRAEHGLFPAELEALSPRFIASVPSPGWGENRWKYSSRQPGDYHLAVSQDASNLLSYSVGPSGQWHREN
ncbi:hypothetical protein IT570_10880 [Candidatus Sumerlaeota bacterium]|nr:hypothetical protein [Candidatus Sumerlaeota bacterium]